MPLLHELTIEDLDKKVVVQVLDFDFTPDVEPGTLDLKTLRRFVGTLKAFLVTPSEVGFQLGGMMNYFVQNNDKGIIEVYPKESGAL